MKDEGRTETRTPPPPPENVSTRNPGRTIAICEDVLMRRPGVKAVRAPVSPRGVRGAAEALPHDTDAPNADWLPLVGDEKKATLAIWSVVLALVVAGAIAAWWRSRSISKPR